MTTTTLTARVDEGLAAAIEVASIVKGRTVTSLVREALEEWLRNSFSEEDLVAELKKAAEKRRQAEEEETERLVERAQMGLQQVNAKTPVGAGAPAEDKPRDVTADDS